MKKQHPCFNCRYVFGKNRCKLDSELTDHTCSQRDKYAIQNDRKGPMPPIPKHILRIRKVRFGPDTIDAYIDSMREYTDGTLTETEQVKYNILNDKRKSTLERMFAYERFLIEECFWRYPDTNGNRKYERRYKKEWKAFCAEEHNTSRKRGRKHV